MKKLTKVVLPEVCSLCDLPANTGLIDMGEDGASAALCPKHLKKFCEITLAKMALMEAKNENN